MRALTGPVSTTLDIMKNRELRSILSSEGFRESSYSFDEKHPDEALCLSQEDNQWLVFYAERGLRTGKVTFMTEDEACGYFLDKMRADPTTRKNWNSGFHV